MVQPELCTLTKTVTGSKCKYLKLFVLYQVGLVGKGSYLCDPFFFGLNVLKVRSRPIRNFMAQ